MRKATGVQRAAPRLVLAGQRTQRRPQGLADLTVSTLFRRVSLANALASRLMVDAVDGRSVAPTSCCLGAPGDRPRSCRREVLGEVLAEVGTVFGGQLARRIATLASAVGSSSLGNQTRASNPSWPT